MPVVTLYLDDRDKQPGEPAPLKYRVYVNRNNIRHFKTNLTLTKIDFAASYLNAELSDDEKKLLKLTRKQCQALKTNIEAIKVKADKIVESLEKNNEFTFQSFERMLYKSYYDKTNVVTCFEDYIKELDADDRVGTADVYRSSLKSLQEFKGNGKPAAVISFNEITVKFLESYEKWFTKEVEGKPVKKLTSVGMYLRNLRFIFNEAIRRGDISADAYPFGKGKYVIPTGSNTKKAIENAALKALYTADLEPGSTMKVCRDYWFFSFQCNGMNFKDIASLRFKNLSESSFSFVREKTKRTVKAKNIAPIMVPITEQVRAFINEYSNSDKNPDNYVFPIFSRGMDEKERKRVNRNFIRLVNDNVQRLADSLDLKIKIRTMTARHSFTTKVTKAAGLEFAQEALGHTSMNTTQNYWAGFETETKKEIANKLLDFD